MCESSSSYSQNSQLMKNRNFYMFIGSNYQRFISQNLKVIGLLGEKILFFIHLGIQIEIDFHLTHKNQAPLSQSFKMILEQQKSEAYSK